MFGKILKASLFIVIVFTLLVPLLGVNTAQAAPAGQTSIWQDVSDIFQRMNEGTVRKEDVARLITALIQFLLTVVVLIGVLFLIIGGYQYMTSTGNPDRIQKAKSTIAYSVAGIIIAGLARSIVEFTRQKISGPADIQDLIINKIIGNALLFFIGLAVLVLIIGGYQYITSAGNPEAIQKAKSTITGAIAGIIIVIFSRTIATFVYNQVKNNPPLEGVLTTFINSLLGVTFSIAVLFLIVGGYQYITSTGNPEAIQKAKNTILYSIIGLIIILLSYAIVNFIKSMAGI
jgi:type IV secretory pathway VirB2 component (pilin)